MSLLLFFRSRVNGSAGPILPAITMVQVVGEALRTPDLSGEAIATPSVTTERVTQPTLE